jgi:hypothetical protein
VILHATELADGTIVYPDDAPKPCALCGLVPEVIVKFVKVAAERAAMRTAENWRR